MKVGSVLNKFIGLGSQFPVSKNTNSDGTDNSEGRKQNRRTEFKILKRNSGTMKRDIIPRLFEIASFLAITSLRMDTNYFIGITHIITCSKNEYYSYVAKLSFQKHQISMKSI